MWDFLNHVIGRTLSSFGQRLEAVGPDLLAMLLILSLGALAAAALRTLLRRLLPRLGFDRFAARLGLSLVLQKGGVTQSPSQAVAAAGAWAVFALSVLLGIGTLNLQFANDLVSRAFNYLPQLLIGVGLVLLGSLISAFLRRTVLIAAVNAGLPSARLLAAGVHTAVMILFVAMALEHLSMGRQIILVSFTILFGGVVLALALSFGLAGRHLAREFLSRVVRPPDAEERADPLRHL
ncbi:MAG TPA: hypothetical protein VKI41_12210 [Vicinamibacteria bacterium]|nr:hypothetical protein [Vicinamibacteria bacterium]